jgi:hypothetical protein
MADLRDFTGKNRKFTGTIGERISTGTTGERNVSFGQGTIRFNITTGLMEYYNGNDWKAIDAPPAITFINVNGTGDTTSVNIDPSQSGSATIQIKGSLFDTVGATVNLIAASGSNISPSTTVRNTSNLLTITVPYSSFVNANEPYDVEVTNGSGLSAILTDCISVDTAPAFINSANTNFDVTDAGRGSVSTNFASATDSQSDPITHSISSGSLPSGLTINSSTGVISGSTDAVGSDTVSTFTVTAATAAASSSRQFTITRKAPVITSFTSAGTGTFSVPVGVTAVQLLMIGGGGSGGGGTGGGGGAGGLVEISSYPVTPGGTVSYRVGAGGPRTNSPGDSEGTGPGVPTFFGPVVAQGGGRGGWDNGPTGRNAMSGGSGGGGHNYDSRANIGSAVGTQPSANPGVANLTQYGNPGGSQGGSNGSGSGGGGGGAGGAGQAGSGNNQAGTGGIGRASSLSGSPVTYAGGGGGAGSDPNNQPGPGGPGGGGNGTKDGSPGDGTANRGSGGGGSWNHGLTGGGGGSGIIIVKY